MVDKRIGNDPTTQAAEPASNDLQREHELVRSGGVISKHVMAIAFGLVFVVCGLAAGTGFNTWRWLVSLFLVPVGVALVGWGFYWVLRRAQRSS